MPGSTSADSSKAKVTSETNGIFVRPVAVAGIFCPANDEPSTPPALPEKRRFSTLLGELRPVSVGETPGADDFARRRQSWDSRKKEVPFGQALLRKTPRNSVTSISRVPKLDDQQNGAPSSNRAPPLEADSKSASKSPLVKSSVKDSTSKSDVQESAGSTKNIGNFKIGQEEKHGCDLTSKQNEAVVVNCTDQKAKLVKSNTSGKSQQEVLRDVKKSNLNNVAELNCNKKVGIGVALEEEKNSTENTKQTKKIYGLPKRDSKQEKPIEKIDLPETVSEVASSTKCVAAKNKVYGVNKNIVKTDSDSDALGNDTGKVNQLSERISIASKTEGNIVEKLPDTKTVESTKKIENSFSESPPKEVRTVRRTSGIIAAKIQDMFSNFQQEKPSTALLKKAKVPDKINSSSVKMPNPPPVSKNEFKSCALSPVINLNSESKVSSLQEVKKGLSNDHVNCNSNEYNVKTSIGSKENANVSSFSMILGDALKQNDSSSKLNYTVQPSNLEGIKVPSKNVSKPEPSINGVVYKQLNKKVDSIEGRMPIKKDDPCSSDGTKPFIIAANQETDRKSPSSTSTSSTVMEVVNKSAGVKQPFSVPSKDSFAVEERHLTSKVSSEGVISSTSSKTTVSQSFLTAHKVQVSSTSGGSVKSISNKSNEVTHSSVNGEVKTSETSKIEITKLTSSTQPGAVPTVNVLFRTKSPQSALNNEENRKKVVIETSSSITPLPSTILIYPKATDSSLISSAPQSISATVKTVESDQVPLNSPNIPKKHTIINLQKQEVARVDLTPNKQPSSNEPKKIESESFCIVDQNKFSAPDISSDSARTFKTFNQEQKSSDLCKVSVSPADNVAALNTSSMEFVNGNRSSSYTSAAIQNAMSVVDLNDWNKKFQCIEPEAPRAPLRRRTFRDSLPPSLPLRTSSRFSSGSLKRIEDSVRYIPRSPSQSSLPQRYSYTEMLSKVCSMGVLPTVEPSFSKSCSSSSSQVSELWSELSEEQSTATHASEMLEAETTERMRLEKEVHELQNRYSQIQHRSDKMEMEIMESRVYRTSELNGDLSEDEDNDGSGSLYKQKYERAVRDMEMMKRRFQQQHDEEMEQKTILKKASDKRLAEALEDVDEERQVANQWKRKAQKCGAELQDIRLMLEEQMARNGELEKKQRRFDAELSSAQEEIKKEKLLREKLTREKDQIVHEKYALEQDLQASKLDSDLLHEKITQLNRELDELTLSSKGEEEVTQLKRAKQELERKSRDQEEELEELAAQVQMLEQAKLRLEMSLEKVRQEHRRETSVRDEEIEEIRASFSKKIKNLEAQLESEQDERHQLVKQKHELERRLYEIADQPPPHDPEIERRLRRDLKRTKALLRDAQSMLEQTREGQSSKTLIRQLKNQLEDSEFAKVTAIKARQAVETELQDCQIQLEEITRTKNEAETRCLQLSREKSAIQTQLEEAEEEMAEVMKKYKAVVAQMSADQKNLAEQNQQIAELETERQMLKEQLSEVSHKFEHLAGQSDDAHKVHWLDSKIRDLESKLELEQTTKARLEHQISRLKEQNDRSREECDSLRNKELQAQEAVRRLQRQIRDSREDYSALQQKEADAYRKQHELEMALENTETDLQVTKNDLRLACQRIQDLQNALEDDLDSGTDVPDDSGSDSDSSFELSVLRNSSLTPIQRCESIASNLSYDTEGPRSRAASFTRELSAFSRMMLKKNSMDFLG